MHYGFAMSLLIVHVQVCVKSESVEAFKRATSTNAHHSLQERGIVRFDVVQQEGEPTRFVLVEVYRDANAAALHKETSHYRVWRDLVAPMMAEPRRSLRYSNVAPEDGGW